MKSKKEREQKIDLGKLRLGGVLLICFISALIVFISEIRYNNTITDSDTAFTIEEIIDVNESVTFASTEDSHTETDTSVTAFITSSAVSETFSESSETVTVDSADSNKLININTASAEELMALNGIGEKIAALIVEYRSEKPFESIEEIMEVKGIGEKKFEAIKDQICC